MGRIVERKVTDTADYTLEITQADGALERCQVLETYATQEHTLDRL